ncbi:YecA family protein [Paucibacter sp. TC2R-5]|uniref:YecA/YgfB family protein n=1 Tax=Paucibacter sp. TC2R-5 TaxID=2893555 RepID=UPI0021E476DE|nr:YecA family protein [Paucibacter sp. TC2R-5]MCV2358386.1 YecA family protein [Paucibacter sp. TC2R-5]
MSKPTPPRPPASRPAHSRSGSSSAAPRSGAAKPSYAPARPGTRPSGASTNKPAAQPSAPAAIRPLSEAELDRLQALLDQVPAPLEPLDVSMLDGYLVGVLLQPKAVPAFQWSRHVLDSEEGRSPPAGFDSHALMSLVKRRYQELNQAITQRQWFDPWVFELEEDEAGEESAAQFEAEHEDGHDDDELGGDVDGNPSDALFPWVAGFSLACEHFPELMREDAADLLEPLAAIFRHIDPEDLEDADDLLEEIESLEPAKDLEEAVESLVSACLMLADVSRPQARPMASQKPPARRGPPPRGRY